MRPLSAMDVHPAQPGDDLVSIPSNFAMVEPGLYRSSFPRTKNISFLKQLGIKVVISLVLEDYPEALMQFYEKNEIKLITHGLEGNKGPFKGIDMDEFLLCLRDVLDHDNRPLLIHCNKGKHRTGCIVACVRRVRLWALSSCLHEYLVFSSPKSRLEDQRFIEAFNPAHFLAKCTYEDDPENDQNINTLSVIL